MPMCLKAMNPTFLDATLANGFVSPSFLDELAANYPENRGEDFRDNILL